MKINKEKLAAAVHDYNKKRTPGLSREVFYDQNDGSVWVDWIESGSWRSYRDQNIIKIADIDIQEFMQDTKKPYPTQWLTEEALTAAIKYTVAFEGGN